MSALHESLRRRQRESAEVAAARIERDGARLVECARALASAFDAGTIHVVRGEEDVLG